MVFNFSLKYLECGYLETVNKLPMSIQINKQEMTRSKCQTIYLTLLELHYKPDSVLASTFIREFFQTETCDEFNDFKPDRDDLRDHIGSVTLNKILTYDENEQDERKATQTALHYYHWHQKRLKLCLNWWNYEATIKSFFELNTFSPFLG